MLDKILCVDDDPHLLAALQRDLRRQFEIDTAMASTEGLLAVESEGPYAVVVSDLRMPEVDGIEFLARIREKSPDTVRVMLTGNADLDAAVAAVNEGNIFRLLIKPMEPGALAKALSAAAEQHHLLVAQRELLENTLNEVIRVLTDVMALIDPMACSRSSRLKRYVRHMVDHFDIHDSWQFEAAAMLSQLGRVTLPPDLLEALQTGAELSAEQQEMVAADPLIAADLLAKIPRLEDVARMIAMQADPCPTGVGNEEPHLRNRTVLGAQMLRVAIRFDELTARGMAPGKAIQLLRQGEDGCDPVIASALETFCTSPDDMDAASVKIIDMSPGMILHQDVRSKSGSLLAPKGQEVTPILLNRLKQFSEGMHIVEPIHVLISPQPQRQSA